MVPDSKVFTKKRPVLVFLLPNLFTTGNMFCGFLAIVSSINLQFVTAAYFILWGAIFDLMDGRVARMTNSTSEFGEQYDSMSDLITFGMAPAILGFIWGAQAYGKLGLIASFFYLAGVAVRLARFNVQAGSVEKRYFMGVPSPMAAVSVASFVLFHHQFSWSNQNMWYLLVQFFVLGILMVSKVRIRSLKDLDLKDKGTIFHLVFAAACLITILVQHEIMLFVSSTLFILMGLIAHIYYFVLRKHEIKQFLTENDLDEDELREDFKP